MQFIELKLVSDAGVPNVWPGVPTSVQANLLENLTAVWIGVSADGTTNAAYPLTTPLATILLSYPRIYQGSQAEILGDTMLYANPLADVNRLLAACCLSTSQGGSSSSSGE